MASLSETLIMDQQQIEHKVRRIAYQIYECNLGEKEIILAGIAKNGFLLAQKIKQSLDEMSELNCVLCEVVLNKKAPLEGVKTSLGKKEYQNKSLVLIDDVLNSGSTLIYGVKHFLQVPLKQFKTAVLVDRNHKKFPVKADFKGISLSTSLNETVKVRFGKKEQVVLI